MPALASRQTTPVGGPLWATIWYALTLAAWLASGSMQRFGESDTASLITLAGLAELVSVAVRWKYFATPGSQKATSTAMSAAELAWLCAWGAQANALGLVAMLSPNLVSILPALLVAFVAEGLLLPKSPFARSAVAAPVTEEIHPQAASAVTPLAIESVADVDPLPESDDEPWTRSTQEGHTETGQRYLSGWVRFQLTAGQKALTLTVGFSPAFPVTPDVELDLEADTEEVHCETLVEHTTPAGMRVAIKRTTAGPPLSGKLYWHASEVEHSGSLLNSRLP